MPLYEYECTLCQHRFEAKQRFDEEPIGVCPICTGKAHRVIHSVTVNFKGSGFYITDHRNPGTTDRPKPSSTEKGKEAVPDKKKGEQA